MRTLSAKILGVVLACLFLAGCGGRTESTTSAAKLPWSRVTDVEVVTENGADPQDPDGASGSVREDGIGPGASQSQVILAWGVPDYILDSKDDADRKIWQYPHSIVVFQGSTVQQIMPR